MATLAELQDDLTKLKAARDAILTGGQSAGTDGANVQRPDIAAIMREIKSVEVRIQLLGAGGGPFSFGTNPIFGQRS